MRASEISAQDYTEILNLYAYYNHCSDDGDAPAYAGCFTAHGELFIPAIDLRVKGRAALLGFKQQDASRRGGRIRRHWNSGLNLTRISADELRGRCYLHGYNGEPGELPQIADVGQYEDRLQKEDGEWRFAQRIIRMDFSSFSIPE